MTLGNNDHRPATSTNRDNFPPAPADFYDIIQSEFRNDGSPRTPAALITFFREEKKRQEEEEEEEVGQEEQFGGSGLKPGRPGQAADTWSAAASWKHTAGHDSPAG